MRKMKSCKTFVIILGLIIVCCTAEAPKKCQVTEDCGDLQVCQANVCARKPLFPITFREVIGTFFFLILNALMTAGGVGAAAAYLPYVQLLFNISLQQAVFIGYTCVFGGGVGNLVNIVTLRNPKTKRFMINYDANMIIFPALMIGVLIGLILNRIFPPIIMNIVLLIILGYSTFKNYSKLKANLQKERKQKICAPAKRIDEKYMQPDQSATKLKIEVDRTALEDKKDYSPIGTNLTQQMSYKQESQNTKRFITFNELPKTENQLPGDNKDSKRESKALETDHLPQLGKTDSHIAPLSPLPSPLLHPEVSGLLMTRDSSKKEEDPILAQKKIRLDQQEIKYPFHKLRELSITILIIIVFGLFRGTKSFKPVLGVDWSCGWDFLWFGLSLLAYTLSFLRNVYLVLKWQKEKKDVGYEFFPEEPVFNKKRIFKLTMATIGAGIAGAMVALGGALLISPVLLESGMPPAYSAATTGVFMIFSMFNAMFQTILNGKLTGAELAWFLSLAFLFSLASSKIVNWHVKKTGKQSTVILLVMIVIILGFLSSLALLIKALIEDFSNQVKFNPVC